MFRSFFPVPKIFFWSAVIWLALTVLVWFTVGGALRSDLSIDRYVVPPFCATTSAEAPTPAAGNPGANAPSSPSQAPATAPSSNAKAAAAVAANTAGSTANCISPKDDRFLSGTKVWLYEYVLLSAFLFCLFWYFYKRNEWYWWSVVTSTVLLLGIFFNVQISAWLNNWYNTFYDLIQLALSGPNKVTIEQYYGELSTAIYILVINITALVVLAFITSHYVFRWRKAMNFYYMGYWPQIRTYEGAAQRVQEDTMRFAGIVEDLGTSFFGSLMTLAVFLPLLWQLSSHINTLPLIGHVPGSLVWVALIWSAFGTVLLATVGIRLPGLNFINQRVEAAYRKELVYGEDDPTRAEPLTARQLFSNLQKNYFRLYFNYLYFNVARYAYLQLSNFVAVIALGPAIVIAALTFGLYTQISNAFGQVSSSFQFLASSWTTIVELLSVHKRLKDFESHIPDDLVIVPEPPLPAPEAGY